MLIEFDYLSSISQCYHLIKGLKDKLVHACHKYNATPIMSMKGSINFTEPEFHNLLYEVECYGRRN
jgi:hypothetical protein